MSSPDEVLGAIDRALDDFAVSDDAMRWTPEPPPEPEEKPAHFLGASPQQVWVGVAGPDGSVIEWNPLRGWSVESEVLVHGEAWEVVESGGVSSLMSFSRLADDARPAVEAFGKFAVEWMGAVDRALHRAGWALAGERDRRGHRRRCPVCNPAGFPRPLAVDGREYRRRRAARQRKKRR